MSGPNSAAVCSYCGLPLGSEPAPETPAAADDVELRYCCYGCRFAAAVTQSSGDVAQARGLMTRLGLALFFTMNVMVFTMFLWSQDGPSTERGAETFYSLGRYVCLLFSAPVLLLLGGPLVEDAISELRRGRPSMSGLLAVGVLAAFVYSLVSVFRGSGHVYFEVSCMVLVAVTLGRWLEANGKLKTTAALRALQRLLPDEVRVLRDGQEQRLPRAQVQPGDWVRVVAGERIPVDGTVRRHRASVDQQAVTGESVPVVKEPGDPVYSGTLNVDGDLWIESATRADADTLSRIIAAVEQAVATQDRYQRLANRLSAWFLPVVATVAIAALVIHSVRADLGEGLLAALAVVVIACPCALGLATPMALWAAVGRAAKAQVLLRDGDCLVRLAHARVFCFDKTGTLTTGQVAVSRVEVAESQTNGQLVSVAAGLASGSTHPLSKAIAQYAAREQVAPALIEDTQTLAGRGLVGRRVPEGDEALLGSVRLMREQDLLADTEATSWSERLTADPEAALALVGWNGQLRGGFLFAEQVRPSAAPALAELKASNREVVMLTGDRALRAAHLAQQLQVEYRADLLPVDKLAMIDEYVRKGQGVVMVGDGINDAPALAAADVGIALGCGADVSRYTAGVCLLGDDLAVLPWLVTLAEQTVRTIRWNLFWAFAYNTVGIAVAALGWLNPILAALAMTVSSLLVVSNSLRLARADEAAVLESAS